MVPADIGDAAAGPHTARMFLERVPRTGSSGAPDGDGRPVACDVYRVLRRPGGSGAAMKAVAAELRMTDRTLRRRLSREGTSFAAIAHDVCLDVATRLLEGTAMPIDDVAALAGFPDASNFRRAFIRWCATTPAAFRRAARHRGVSGDAGTVARNVAGDVAGDVAGTVAGDADRPSPVDLAVNPRR